MNEKAEYVREEQVTRACRQRERKNLKEKKSSLTAGSMSNRLNAWTIEIQGGGKTCIMRAGWREFVKTL